MKRIILCVVVLCVWMSEQAEAQFRNRTQQSSTTPELNEDNLNYAAPQEYTIAGIEVTGLSLLDKSAMVSLTGLKIGDKIKIPGDGISGAIRKLWKHGLIGDAIISVQKIEGDQVFLLIARRSGVFVDCFNRTPTVK